MNGRPTGVTVVAILDLIGGALNLLGGISMIALGPMIAAMFASRMGEGKMLAYFASIVGVLGVALIIGGIVGIVVGYGLLKGFGWAWWIQVILSALGLISGVLALISGAFMGVIDLVINGLIVYYFTRPHVKAYFGM